MEEKDLEKSGEIIPENAEESASPETVLSGENVRMKPFRANASRHWRTSFSAYRAAFPRRTAM